MLSSVGQPNDSIKNRQSKYHSDRGVFLDFPADLRQPEHVEQEGDAESNQTSTARPLSSLHTRTRNLCNRDGQEAPTHIPADESPFDLKLNLAAPEHKRRNV
jgi:hypothetical protein